MNTKSVTRRLGVASATYKPAGVFAILVIALLTAVAAAAAPPKIVVVEKTLEAAPSYLYVHAQFRTGDKVITGAPGPMDAMRMLSDLNQLQRRANQPPERATSFRAFLDTGASGHVVSSSLIRRFAIQRDPDAVYHETGLHGQTAMKLTMPYTLALANFEDANAKAGKFDHPAKDTVFMVNPAEPNALVTLSVGEINVIGMPVIANLLVEIDPSPMMGGGGGGNNFEGLKDLDPNNPEQLLQQMGKIQQAIEQAQKLLTPPRLRLHDPKDAAARPKADDVDLEIPLHYVDFNRKKNPDDHGRRPSLAPNPMVNGVEARHAGSRFTSNWLLDTGAPITIISTRQAKRLGLYDANGKPTRAPAFTMPLGGVGGQTQQVSGYRIERLRVPTADGTIIEYRNPSVVVKDITAPLDNGKSVTLDGVFGLNLLLPTMSGVDQGIPTDTAAGPFAHLWIDGPNRKLLLKLAEK